MSRGNVAFAVILLATVGGSMALTTSGAGTATRSASTSIAQKSASSVSAATAPNVSEYSATEILKQFLYGQDMKAPVGEASTEALGKIIQDQGDPRYKYSIDSIIATLPDPIESGLSDKLDDEIDAIQKAAESQGYVLDRFKLPWPTRAERAAKGGEAEIDQSEDSEPTRDETEHAGAKPGQRSEPGVLLFRDGHSRHLLVVFLVGETPTSGIHKPALSRALQQACELRNSFASALPRGDGSDNCPPISIMGPAFSGSQDSVVFAIHDWRSEGSVGYGQTSCRDVKIRNVSGSTTTSGKVRIQD